MRHVVWFAALLCGAAVLFAPITPAQAQATRTWVSGVGDDLNPCSRTAPCKTFAGAISKTAAGGEISVLDPGGFGTVTITKSISIVNDYSGEAGILASGTTGVIVNAGANDVVLLRGLVIDGGTPASPGLNGIRFIAGGALHVQKCVIKNFTSSSSNNGNGILFSSSGASMLFVSDSYISNNGGGSTGGGILVTSTGSSDVKAIISNVRVTGNVTGITATGFNATGGNVLVNVVNSVTAGNKFTGISSNGTPAGALTVLMADRTSIVNNATGVSAAGTKGFAYLASSTVFGNSTGLSASSSGQILSYQDNNIIGGNIPTDGAPTGPLNKN